MSFLKSVFIDKLLTTWWAVVVVMLALPFAVWFMGFFTQPTSLANACRSFGEHQVCVQSIRRSAQRYWEYRTVVSVDGIKQPLELYNCRDRIRTLAFDSSPVPFATGKTGDWICQITQPKRAKEIEERGEIVIR